MLGRRGFCCTRPSTSFVGNLAILFHLIPDFLRVREFYPVSWFSNFAFNGEGTWLCTAGFECTHQLSSKLNHGVRVSLGGEPRRDFTPGRRGQFSLRQKNLRAKQCI